MYLQRENESEKAETREKVEEDRKPQIEAAIVRIMKVGGSACVLRLCRLQAAVGGWTAWNRRTRRAS